VRRLNAVALGLAGLLSAATGTAHELQAEMTIRNFGRISGNDPMLIYAGTRTRLRYEHHEDWVNLVAEGRLRWNGVFMGNPPYSQEARDAYEVFYDWREAYASFPVLGADLSLGWQQVVWGKADQLRILDHVNPLDLREFVLLDLHDYRRAVPMVRVERAIADWETEFLWIPRFLQTSLGKQGSEYPIPLIPPGTEGVELTDSARYDSIGAGSEYGARVSHSFEGVDLSLVGFYTRDDLPVLEQSAIANPDPAGPYVGLQQQHHRYFLGGLSFAAPVSGAAVLRGEFSYVPSRTYNLIDDFTGNGLIRRGEISAMLAVDYTVGDWMLSLQALNRTVLDWRPDVRTGQFGSYENTPTFTVSAQGNSLGGRLETRLFLATMPVTNDGSWLQVKNTYRFDDHWSAAMIMDFMFGPKEGFFGQFGDRDRVGLEISYNFGIGN
jgi:hypothetical protein